MIRENQCSQSKIFITNVLNNREKMYLARILYIEKEFTI